MNKIELRYNSFMELIMYGAIDEFFIPNICGKILSMICNVVQFFCPFLQVHFIIF